MEFWIYDNSTNRRRTVDVSNDPILVGRSEQCDIVLKGPFVAQRHCKLFRKGNQIFVEALGRSGTRLANRDIDPESPVPVDFGDELQIGQFSIAVVRPHKRDLTRGTDDELELQRALVEFEEKVHGELLERMNLRVTANINKNDASVVDQILAHLDEILDERIDEMSAPLIQHTVRNHLHRLVIAEVVRQCQGKVQTEYQTVDDRLLNTQREHAIDELVTSMVDLMPLLFDPASVQEDLVIAEEAFDEVLEQNLSSISKGLRQYIVRRTVSKDIQDIMFGLGPLQDLLEMANVSEIMVVGKDRIYVEKNGVIQPTTRSFFSDEILMSVIERILAPIGRRVDHSTPLVDGRLPDGSRINVIISPLSLVGPCVTIRKFSWIPFTMDDLISRETISEQAAAFLQGCITGRKNLIVSGGTGSGKTTLLNTLAAYALPTERIITIEESAELRLPQPHMVGLESKPSNIEGKGAFHIRELVRNALRMRPDRIIVGEVRGAEALDMLQAMNTGHDGSLSTLHANNPSEAMQRLETLVLMAIDMPVRAVREQIVSAVHVVVQLARLASGQRRVTRISEVVAIDRDTEMVRLEDIYTLRDPSHKRMRHTGYIPTFAEDMITQKRIKVDVFL